MRMCMYFAVCLLLAACEAEKPEVVDLEDILTESERYPEGQNPEDAQGAMDSLAMLKKNLGAAGIQADEVMPWTELLFPERFGPRRSYRFQLASGKDTLRFASLSFQDSLRVMNTVYNWIDCFGARCKSVFVGQQVGMQKRPFMVFVGDTSMIFVEANEALDYEKWQGYLESLGYAKDWNILIEQKKAGVARWYTFEDEEKINWKK